MTGIGGVVADTFAEVSKFIGVGAVPYFFVGRMLTELAMLHGLAGVGIQDGEVPVVDEVGWVLAAYI